MLTLSPSVVSDNPLLTDLWLADFVPVEPPAPTGNVLLDWEADDYSEPIDIAPYRRFLRTAEVLV